MNLFFVFFKMKMFRINKQDCRNYVCYNVYINYFNCNILII